MMMMMMMMMMMTTTTTTTTTTLILKTTTAAAVDNDDDYYGTCLFKDETFSFRYSLSTKVKDILGPDFKFADKLRTEEATVEDLLAHKMAIPANNRLRFNDNITRDNIQE
jgi:hypothetical protein